MSSNQNRSPGGSGSPGPSTRDGAQTTGTSSGKVTRPIDAPSLPPWLPRAAVAGRPASGNTDDEEDAPTQNVLFGEGGPLHTPPRGTPVPAPPPATPAPEPPKATPAPAPAQVRVTPDTASARPAPERFAPTRPAPQPTPPPAPPPPAPVADPRELARRLANEAKQKLAAPPAEARAQQHKSHR